MPLDGASHGFLIHRLDISSRLSSSLAVGVCTLILSDARDTSDCRVEVDRQLTLAPDVELTARSRAEIDFGGHTLIVIVVD